jgi:hypothetical protein
MAKVWDGLSIQERKAMLSLLEQYELPKQTLPLCCDRSLFSGLPREITEHVIREAASIPERRGRLTDVARSVLDLSTSRLARYTVIESHIDLTDLDEGLAHDLIAAGFEPDDFALMQPAQYRHHFTQQFVCETRSRTAQLYELLVKRNAVARRLIEDHPITTGYLETEVYRSIYTIRFAAKELSAIAVDRFPSSSLDFEIRAVPRSSAEAAVSGMPVDAHRAADIHIKVPGGFSPYTGRPTEERIQDRQRSRAPAERLLVERLSEAGFYEIASQAGNFLYSAHFAEMAEANDAFRTLACFAADAGGISGLVRESCTSLWRKASITNGEMLLAEVPPLLRSSWDSTQVRIPVNGGP